MFGLVSVALPVKIFCLTLALCLINLGVYSDIESIRFGVTIAALAFAIIFVFNVWSGKRCSPCKGLLFDPIFFLLCCVYGFINSCHCDCTRSG